MLEVAGLVAVQVSSTHQRMTDRGGQWGIAVLAVGVALLCGGAVPMLRRRRWRAVAGHARGQVVDQISRPGRRHREARSPVVQFEAEGTVVRFRAPDGRTPSWRMGQPVEVLYDRQDPRIAGLADTGLGLSWALILGIAVIGAFAAVISS